MFVHFLAVMAQAVSETPYVTVSGVAVASLDAGLCRATGFGILNHARLRVSWSTAGADRALYEVRVYEDGILQATVPLTAAIAAAEYQWDKTVYGLVEDGPSEPFTAGWVYRVDVVRIADGIVVSTSSAAPWNRVYGACAREGGAL